ncbi:hypothetical protein TNIN_299921 [Trichonephila inaurata madagascariensis]|uniref:Uncharacterized protein n=1 Tax=Trichonephila inaurata madagascariensis TaxID=2747483 RepID=A0A8X6XEK1_9ARAC|nr:hypothetical protein TNIN_299921 [Trichonephila inaurata madagascariensis]
MPIVENSTLINTYPVLEVINFVFVPNFVPAVLSAGGVAATSAASIVQSYIGTVSAGSTFAESWRRWIGLGDQIWLGICWSCWS